MGLRTTVKRLLFKPPASKASFEPEVEQSIRDLLRHDSLVEMTAASFNRLALAAMEATEYETAITHFNQAIQLRPDIGQYYFHRALLLRATGQFEAAKADHLIAVRLDPEFMSVDFERLSLGMKLKQLPKPDEDAA